MAKGEPRKSIRLNLRQAKWLETLAPEKAHSQYVALREKKNPGVRDALFDHGNFRRFLRGGLGCSRELAESVFEVYGTTVGQVEAIRGLGARFRVPGAFKDTEESALATTEAATKQFFEQCGTILWDGAFQDGGFEAADSIETPKNG